MTQDRNGELPGFGIPSGEAFGTPTLTHSPVDRIVQLRVAGLRAIDNLELDLGDLGVLIGDNGVGKSCIVEALELLRQASNPVSHVNDVINKRHGGLNSLLRRGASELSLGVSIEGAGARIEFDFSVAIVGTGAAITKESLDVYAALGAKEPLHALVRDGTATRAFDVLARQLVEVEVPILRDSLALPWLGVVAQPAVKRALAALDAIDVHVPFESRPLWQHHELGLKEGPRWPSMVENASKLSRFGLNLPNAFQTLRNRGGETWSRVLERAKLGLGDDLRDFSMDPSGRGKIELGVRYGSFPDAPLPAESLSDGQITYLCFVALCEFHRTSSLLIFDEPELHLHPALLSRVAWMLEEAAKQAPILITTHSNAFLDALADPAESVILVELDEHRATRIKRPEREALTRWLERYRGFGELRAEGYEAYVFEESDSPHGSEHS